MVDLVKIRKKAKEKKEAGEAAREEAALHVETPEPPAREPEAPATAAIVAPAAPVTSQSQPAATQESPAQPVSDKLAAFRRTAGLRRGEEEQQEGEQAAAELLELLLFNIEGEQYALPIETIVEIARPRITTRVPNADESVIGILSLRGTIVTILDIRRRLGHPSSEETTDDTRVIVVEFRGETCGFVVDRVSRVIRVTPAELENHPVVNASEQSEFIRGVFQHAQRLSILLDLDRLLRF